LRIFGREGGDKIDAFVNFVVERASPESITPAGVWIPGLRLWSAIVDLRRIPE
jgi:hypothetical protein